MTAARGAKFEAQISKRVVLYDVSHQLPVGRKQYKTRSVPGIDRLFIHKSGADGPPGYKGCVGMARFCTAEEPDGRDWPGAPYHFWNARVPDVDERGCYVLYRCQPDNVWSNHSGKYANERGIAHCVQGNYDSEWDLLSTGRPRITKEPTDAQMAVLEDFVDWAIDRYRLKLPEGLSGHWEAPKPKRVCPGDFLRQWVCERRGTLPKLVENGTVAIPQSERGEVDLSRPSVEVLQRALHLAGFDPGPIDGLWGYRSRKALERFQAEHELVVDGHYGPMTAGRLLEALRAKGVASLALF